jgi:hypothetical protein
MRLARGYSLFAPGGGRGKGAWRRLTALLALLLMAPRAASADSMIAEPTAVLQGLDKTTARASDFAVPVGKTVRFGDLSILVRACKKNPPIDTPESTAFLQIDNLRPGAGDVQEFSGWMFAESPALSALEDPIYDVILLDCKGASEAPAPNAASSAPGGGSSDGNTAR